MHGNISMETTMAKVKIVVNELDKEICHLYGRFDKRGFLYLERLGGDKEP